MNTQCKQEKRPASQIAFVLFAFLGGIFLSEKTRAVDNWNVDGEHGELHVQGQLMEGACSLGMTSVFQNVELGNIPRASLMNIGAEGQPVRFRLTLRDCSRSGGSQTNRYTGVHVQDAIQPVVTLSFSGVADPDMPAFFKVQGASGLALKLSDPQGRNVRPGLRGEPMFITPGDNDLMFTVTPVRTLAPLTAGEFLAAVNFEVSYD